MIVTEQDMEYLCDELCRHPRECKEQQELDEICEKCPFAAKMEGDGEHDGNKAGKEDGCCASSE